MDLKSPNILLTRHGVAKLADVGLAKVIRDREYISQVKTIGERRTVSCPLLSSDYPSFGIRFDNSSFAHVTQQQPPVVKQPAI
jgi:serine/threonine protein kinase